MEAGKRGGPTGRWSSPGDADRAQQRAPHTTAEARTIALLWVTDNSSALDEHRRERERTGRRAGGRAAGASDQRGRNKENRRAGSGKARAAGDMN
jgi:hypothetical protein